MKQNSFLILIQVDIFSYYYAHGIRTRLHQDRANGTIYRNEVFHILFNVGSCAA